MEERQKNGTQCGYVATAEDVVWGSKLIYLLWFALSDALVILLYEKRSWDERLNVMPLLIILNEVLHFRLDVIFNNGLWPPFAMTSGCVIKETHVRRPMRELS